MAIFKTLRKKQKEFVFKAYGNNKDASPAKIVFARFPLPGELFIEADRKDIFKGIKLDAVKDKDEDEKQKILDHLWDNYLDNIKNSRIDYKAFVNECVEKFVDFTFVDDTGKKQAIATPQDFLESLPDEMWQYIAIECYEYAMKADQFTVGE